MENKAVVGANSRLVRGEEKRKKSAVTKKRNFLFLLSVFIFYLVIAALLILSGDDWAWGGDIGQARLANKFDEYNGRYFGNIIEMIITRSMIARLLIYSAVNTGIVFFMRKIMKCQIPYIYCFLVILLLPVSFYSQTYGWLAGFANYNTSTFLLLWIVCLVKKNGNSIFSLSSIFILSCLCQFFIENMTIASVLIATIGLVSAIFFKDHIFPYFSWLLGSIMGAFIMFSNSAYHIENNMRGFSNVDMHSFFTTLLTEWSELYVKQNALLLFLFTIVMYLLTENKGLGKLVLYFLPSSYFILRYLLNISWQQQPLFILIFELLLIVIFLVTLIVVVSKSSIAFVSKRYFFNYLTISLMLLAPFLVVTPFGPRNILTSYVFLTLALFELVIHTKLDLASHLTKKLALTLGLCLALFCIALHGVNKYEENQRIAQLKQAIRTDQKEIEIKRLPYEFIGHDLTPPNGSVQGDRQKVYHGVPLDTIFNITGYHDSSLDKMLEKQQ